MHTVSVQLTSNYPWHFVSLVLIFKSGYPCVDRSFGVLKVKIGSYGHVLSCAV